MQGLVIVLIVLAVAGALYLNVRLRRQRREGWQRAAASLGLSFTEHDPYGLLDLPFRLLRSGDGQGIDHVAAGTIDGVPVKVFDFWFYEETTNSKGHTSRSYSRFTCALVTVPVRCSPTTIERETIFTRIADAVGFRDLEFESEEFNRAFQVKSTDAKFASYLIDARMMEWLLATNGDSRFELSGDAILCSTRRIRPEQIPWMVARARGFRDSMPRVLHDVYGGDA